MSISVPSIAAASFPLCPFAPFAPFPLLLVLLEEDEAPEELGTLTRRQRTRERQEPSKYATAALAGTCLTFVQPSCAVSPSRYVCTTPSTAKRGEPSHGYGSNAGKYA